MSGFQQYLFAFLIGGLICLIAQLLISLTRLTPVRILVAYVTAGAILTGIGLYEPLVRIAGAGATVPLTGFGYCLAKGAIEGAGESGSFGAITGGVKASAAGITAAVFFGYMFALIFRSKTKK